MANKKMSPHLDKLIRQALGDIERQRPYWHKSDISRRVYANDALKKKLKQLDGMGNGYNFGGLVRSQIENMVGAVMQEKDAYGIRRYECYAAGEKERRWQPLQAMTLATLRVVAREAHTQARSFHVKGSGYELLIDALEQLGQGEDAQVSAVYHDVAPKIMEARS